jgi:serine/threonine protein kinase
MFCYYTVYDFIHTGHLKLVDFGTCKDLINKDLNGPEFVGTAEYMSPEVLANQDTGPETDLWSLGVTLFQLVTGYTPFAAPSPYLSFLRIKRSFLRMPLYLPDDVKDLIRLLITKSRKKRLQNVLGYDDKGDSVGDHNTDHSLNDNHADEIKQQYSYQKLISTHPFFREVVSSREVDTVDTNEKSPQSSYYVHPAGTVFCLHHSLCG